VKNKWGEFLLEQQRDVYLSMRVRIALRKAGVIPMEDKKKEEECIAKEKRAVKSNKKNLGKYAVSEEDVIKAFSDGDEVGHPLTSSGIIGFMDSSSGLISSG